MLASTHVVFASTLYLGGATLFGYDVDPIGWALAAVASLGPDVDLPTSRLGRASSAELCPVAAIGAWKLAARPR